MAKQGILPLTLPPVYAESNFQLYDCNREAHAWIGRWPDWPGGALLLYGPPGSGKTHLGHLWAARAQAKRMDAAIADPDPASLSQPVWIDHTERIRRPETLLHTINYARERGLSVLLTSETAAASLPFTLPDLTSRLRALPAVPIHAPDEDALRAVLRKQFSDRQMKIDEEALSFLLARMERSFTQAQQVVDRLDREALSAGRALTIPFIKQLLS